MPDKPKRSQELAQRTLDLHAARQFSRSMIWVLGISLLVFYAGPAIFHAVMAILVWAVGTGALVYAVDAAHTRFGKTVLSEEDIRQLREEAGPE